MFRWQRIDSVEPYNYDDSSYGNNSNWYLFFRLEYERRVHRMQKKATRSISVFVSGSSVQTCIVTHANPMKSIVLRVVKQNIECTNCLRSIFNSRAIFDHVFFFVPSDLTQFHHFCERCLVIKIKLTFRSMT